MSETTKNFTPSELLDLIEQASTSVDEYAVYVYLESQGFHIPFMLKGILTKLNAEWEDTTSDLDHELQQPGLNRLGTTLIGYLASIHVTTTGV